MQNLLALMLFVITTFPTSLSDHNKLKSCIAIVEEYNDATGSAHVNSISGITATGYDFGHFSETCSNNQLVTPGSSYSDVARISGGTPGQGVTIVSGSVTTISASTGTITIIGKSSGVLGVFHYASPSTAHYFNLGTTPFQCTGIEIHWSNQILN